jgi:pyridoxine 5-phosphate synthase
MIRLSVNVNKAATLRNARGGNVPDVVRVARTCLDAGAHGITVHPRPDERHIRRSDVLALARALTVDLGIEFNVEGYPSPGFLALIEEVRPAQCTLVPDPPDVLTSNAGWDLRGDVSLPRAALEELARLGVRSSLFLEPDPDAVRRARDLGADRGELYTESYARTYGGPEGERTFERFRRAAEAALDVGLGLNAGHDLDLRNLPHFAAHIPGLLEVSIGHALISDALFTGLRPAVTAYLTALGHRT